MLKDIRVEESLLNSTNLFYAIVNTGLALAQKNSRNFVWIRRDSVVGTVSNWFDCYPMWNSSIRRRDRNNEIGRYSCATNYPSAGGLLESVSHYPLGYSCRSEVRMPLIVYDTRHVLGNVNSSWAEPLMGSQLCKPTAKSAQRQRHSRLLSSVSRTDGMKIDCEIGPRRR